MKLITYLQFVTTFILKNQAKSVIKIKLVLEEPKININIFMRDSKFTGDRNVIIHPTQAPIL